MICRVSDRDLLALVPRLVLLERERSADVIEHLVELDRRRLYLEAACGSLSSYCIERLGYSEDEAAKRVRVARLANLLPQVLDELRTGRIHLTGLCLLAHYLTPDNADELLEQSRSKSKRQIEELVAREFPRPDVPPRIDRQPEQLSIIGNGSAAAASGQEIRSGTGTDLAAASNGVQPLSASRWSVHFTGSDALHDKIERAWELTSHAVPRGDLSALFERALDALIERETKRRLGAGKPRKHRLLAPGSRHVPVEIARQVWERDGGQCTFVDEQGRRCSQRRFITLEHIYPYALGGPPTLENLCLLCKSHNLHSARKVFGDATIDAKCRERTKPVCPASRPQSVEPPTAQEPVSLPNGVEPRITQEPMTERLGPAELKHSEAYLKVHAALRGMGFQEPKVRRTMAELAEHMVAPEPEPLLRAALAMLVPDNAKQADALPPTRLPCATSHEP